MTHWLQWQLFWRSFFLQTGWNFAKYQNLGLAFVMTPFLKTVYKQKKDLPHPGCGRRYPSCCYSGSELRGIVVLR